MSRTTDILTERLEFCENKCPLCKKKLTKEERRQIYLDLIHLRFEEIEKRRRE